MITVIGTGNMGGAIASSLIKSGFDVSVYDKDEKKAKTVIGAKILKSLSDTDSSDIVIIAVKPDVLPTIYDELRAINARVYISIAAGVPLSVLISNLGTDRVVRFMPNLAALCKKSVTAVCYGTGITEKEMNEVEKIAESFGSFHVLEEEEFDAFIGISGSGIAYVLSFMHYAALGGTYSGIPYPESLKIVSETMESAACLQRASGRNPMELVSRVCSAKGTTIEGIKALEDKSFAAAVINAVVKSADKSRNMAKNSEVKK